MRASSTSPTAFPRHAVRQGAIVLANALPFAEPGVHLAVVDPGVGSERRPVAVARRRGAGPGRPRQRRPRPGRCERLGGAGRAVDLTPRPSGSQPVTATFHGRDLFAPVGGAARRRGRRSHEAGEALDPAPADAARAARAARLPGPGRRPRPLRRRLRQRHPQRRPRRPRLHLPRASATGSLVDAGSARVTVPSRAPSATSARGRGLLYEDSARALALAVNRDSAAELLGLAPDDEVTLSPA